MVTKDQGGVPIGGRQLTFSILHNTLLGHDEAVIVDEEARRRCQRDVGGRDPAEPLVQPAIGAGSHSRPLLGEGECLGRDEGEEMQVRDIFTTGYGRGNDDRQSIDHDPDQNTHRMSSQFGRSNSGWLAAVRVLGFQNV